MKKTPLYDVHVSLSANMVEFAGYAMPVRYASEKAEHFAVRTAVGLFDVSHMGEVFLLGPKAVPAADLLLSNDVARLSLGQALYAVMPNEKGGIVDDVVAYKFSDEKVLICVNASNREKDYKWIKNTVAQRWNDSEVRAVDSSDDYAQLALQGPRAQAVLQHLALIDLATIQRFHFAETVLKWSDSRVPVILARTGYTGEDGFEIFVAPQDAVGLWNELVKIGEADGLMPCGLSARDTLRLEAGMCLYGNDINDETTPLEAGLSWVVKWNKDVEFIGQVALARQRETGLGRKLVGLTLTDRNIARSHYEVVDAEGKKIGEITSGTMSPTLGYPIAMAYLQKPFAELGTKVYVKIRQNLASAFVTKLPFYKRAKAEG